ncbi:hypothetical protein NKH18_11245 [Streptomyces sp. M10(2022)]
MERCTGAVYQVLFDPTGQLLTSCDSDGKVRLWKVAGHPRTGRTVTLHDRQPTAHRGSAWACAFHPRDRQLLTVGNDGGAQIWDADTGQGRRILRGHGRRVTGLSFSADSSLIAAAGNDGRYACGKPGPAAVPRSSPGGATGSSRPSSAPPSPSWPPRATTGTSTCATRRTAPICASWTPRPNTSGPVRSVPTAG